MKPIRVAAVSMNSEFAKQREILDRIRAWCEKAAGEKADLVLFPELIVHGHCTPNTWDLAEPVPDGPSVRKLAEYAQHYKLFLAVGLSEKENSVVYNAQVVVGPNGYLGKQRKIHMSRDESLFYKGGRDISVFDLETEFVIDPQRFESKSRNTCFSGQKVRGRAVHAFVGGRHLLKEGQLTP